MDFSAEELRVQYYSIMSMNGVDTAYVCIEIRDISFRSIFFFLFFFSFIFYYNPSERK
jgi:hypothetical protein